MLDRYALPDMARVWSERHKLELWRRVEILAVEGWAEVGAVPAEAAASLGRAAGFPLDEAFVSRQRELEAEVRHDLIAFVTALGERLGPDARFLHRGLTSYDVVDTALSLALVESCDLLLARVKALQEAVASQARRHRHTAMAGRTHGVLAQPITWGWKMCLWWAQLDRDRRRLEAAREAVRVGKLSGAVGSYANLDPRVEEHVLGRLGLAVAPVSSQVLGRDRHAQFLSALAVCASGLERLATEIRLLSRTEVREVEEPFYEGQKGSSAMPHKRNPVQCERIAGLARVVRGHAGAALENVALWHERDLSNSAPERIILPEACLLLDFMLDSFRQVMEGLRVFPDRMLENLQAGGGLAFSEAVMLALVGRGLNRDRAYRLVQARAAEAWAGRGEFRRLVAEDPEIRRVLDAADLERCFDLQDHLRRLDLAFGRLGLAGEGEGAGAVGTDPKAAAAAPGASPAAPGAELHVGKAKRVLAGPSPDTVWLEFTDRATAGDGAKSGVLSGKGEVNCRVSALAFAFLESRGFKTHLVRQDGPRRLLVRRLEIVPLECVVRNLAAGSLCRRLGLEEGRRLDGPVVELYYKCDRLHDPLVNPWHARALGWAFPGEVEALESASLEANRLLQEFFGAAGLLLVDFKLEFGRRDGGLLLGDEVSPDTCRLWDRSSLEKLDKDRFRQDLGGTEEAYREVLARLERAWGGGGGSVG